MPRHHQSAPSFCLILLSTLSAAAQGSEVPDYNRDIRPLLSENCFFCHGQDANKRKADIRLDVRDEAIKAGVLKPGAASESEMIARLFAEDEDERMPPAKSNRHLTSDQKDLLKRWVDAGAKYDPHWAFQKIVKPPPKQVKDEAWIRNDIDRYVIAGLEKRRVSPSPEAERTTLIRRVTLDLTGLPPTAEEVAAYLTDSSPQAYEKVVDRLLTSPHYGERMAWPWLDAARYADSNGFQQDGDRHQYIWRDWVVRAFNENLPFDQFTTWQLAGDLLKNPSQDQLIATGFNRNHMLNGEGGAIKEEQRVNVVIDRVDTTSTVWLGLTMACAQCHDHKYDPVTQKDFYRFFAFFNNVPETGGVDRRGGGGCDEGNLRSVQYSRPWLEMPTPENLTLRKQHKETLRELENELKPHAATIASLLAAWEGSLSDKEKRDARQKFPRAVALALLDGPDGRTEGRTKELRNHFLAHVQEGNPRWKEIGALLIKTLQDQQNNEDAIPTVMIMGELAGKDRRETHVLDRGDYLSPREKVEPGTPAFLPPLPAGVGSDRLAVAHWLVSKEHPLTARVTVNRFWQMLFGMGLVKTPEDFGLQSEMPLQKELLDWLAWQYMHSGWDTKALLRLMVTSATYRQSSRHRADLAHLDPENRWLARGARYRLPAFMLRDQALMLSGLLDDRIGGAPVYPYQPDGLWEDFSFGKISYPQPREGQLHRRSLYTFWRRTLGPTNMFDSSPRQACSVKSLLTNTPLHALTLLNDLTYVESARFLAQRMVKTWPNDSSERLAGAFKLVTARPPSAAELRLLQECYAQALADFKANLQDAKALGLAGITKSDLTLDTAQLAAHTAVAQLLLNLDEVLTRE